VEHQGGWRAARFLDRSSSAEVVPWVSSSRAKTAPDRVMRSLSATPET
jgi:hypothetical protein